MTSQMIGGGGRGRAVTLKEEGKEEIEKKKYERHKRDGRRERERERLSFRLGGPKTERRRSDRKVFRVVRTALPSWAKRDLYRVELAEGKTFFPGRRSLLLTPISLGANSQFLLATTFILDQR